MVILGLVLGALSGYGLGLLGMVGRIACGGLLLIHALYLLLAILICFVGREPGDSGRLGAGGLTEYLTITLGFDAAMIVAGRLAGVSALDWRWTGGAAAITLICAALLERRYRDDLRRNRANDRPHQARG